MSEIAIRVENLGKAYQIRRAHSTARYRTLQEGIIDLVRRPMQRSAHRDGREMIWALKDVSFEIKQGEVVGIIGRNGAGKSTLLKILSRITEPTCGYADVYGRVGSLLEVGTGFHPELTGRENIYLSGAILGMKRTEIVRKFDEIVAFAEVGKFIDTPMKRYSSGMNVRLAFAVAAHLEPEILLVDEVLAVGDAAFQKKCLGKMGEVAKGGRTVLFVSHNMAAVEALCNHCFLLEDGRKVFSGESRTCVQRYFSGDQSSSAAFSDARRTHRSVEIEIESGRMLRDGVESQTFLFGDPLAIELLVLVRQSITVSVELLLRDQNGIPVGFNPSGLAQGNEFSLTPGRHRVSCRVASLSLAEGRYTFDLILAEARVRFFDYLEAALSFTVGPTRIGPRNWNFSQRGGQGCFFLPVSYSLETAC